MHHIPPHLCREPWLTFPFKNLEWECKGRVGGRGGGSGSVHMSQRITTASIRELPDPCCQE